MSGSARSRYFRAAGRGPSDERGAAAVEFALVCVPLVMLLFGIIGYGLALWQLQSLRAATREGARIAAVGGTRDQVLTAVESAAGAQAGSLSSALGISLAANSNGKYCPVSGQSNASVTVSLQAGALPENFKRMLSFQIPLGPQIDLNPTIKGTFRCEGYGA